jgi:hypothetical protein
LPAPNRRCLPRIDTRANQLDNAKLTRINPEEGLDGATDLYADLPPVVLPEQECDEDAEAGSAQEEPAEHDAAELDKDKLAHLPRRAKKHGYKVLKAQVTHMRPGTEEDYANGLDRKWNAVQWKEPGFVVKNRGSGCDCHDLYAVGRALDELDKYRRFLAYTPSRRPGPSTSWLASRSDLAWSRRRTKPPLWRRPPRV